MGRRSWAATLAALGFLGAGGTAATAQTAGRPAVEAGPVLPPPGTIAFVPAATRPEGVVPPPLPAAPLLPPPAAGAPGELPGVLVSTPPAPPLVLPTQASAAPAPSTAAPASGSMPTAIVPAPAATISAPPLPAPKPVDGTDETPMPGTAVGSSPTLPAPAPAASKDGSAGTTPGSSPASSGTMGGAASGSATTTGGPSAPVTFKFKPGDEHLLQMEAANGLFKFFAGGRLQIDAVWVRTGDAVQAPRTAGGIGKLDDAVNFRRGRFDFGGTFNRTIDFLMEWDFINTFNAERTGNVLAANTPVPTDMWVTFKEVPWVGNFRVGGQKPPISFEHMTSSRFLNFMERSLGFDAFIENQNNGFEFGASVFDTYLDERGTWAVGVFKNTRSIFGWNVGDGEYDLTGRVTYLPVYDCDGEYLVHVGLGASHRDYDDDIDRVRARTLIRNGPAILHNIVAEAIVGGSSRDMVNPEFVVVWGPWTFQSEYQCAWFHDATVPATGPGPRVNYGTARMQAGYAEVLYFLTGEHRFYNRKTAAFGRVTPNENFNGFGTADGCDGCDAGCGTGAWQVGARYSWIDLDNRGVRGGTIHDVTLGLNWFLNPYMKWQWNLEWLYRNAPNPAHDGWVYGFGTRLAFDF